MTPNKSFHNMSWWEKVVFCCFCSEENRTLTRQSIIMVPILVSFILNSAGIYGTVSCAASLVMLACHTTTVVLAERYYDKVMSK